MAKYSCISTLVYTSSRVVYTAVLSLKGFMGWLHACETGGIQGGRRMSMYTRPSSVPSSLYEEDVFFCMGFAIL